mgnify:FL=1
MASNMFDVKQLAEYLNVSISLIRKLVKNKNIPYVRLGVKILFSKIEIDKWLLEQQKDNLN